MSTLLSEYEPSKCICECCCRRITYPRIPSAKSYSVWNARNDSSNVSSLLAPDLHSEEKSERSTTNRTIISKSHARRCIKSANLTPKGSEAPTHCEDCYCRDTPNLPTLDLKPICHHRDDIAIRIPNVRRIIRDPRKRNRNCGVKRIPKDPEGVKASTDKSIGTTTKSNFSYTHARSDYESKAGDLQRIDETDEQSETHEGTQSSSKSMSLFEKHMSYKDFKDLVQFRKDNYFDCHAVGNGGSAAVPEHKCIHKFVLNDRLLPQPLNTDSFGISRCDVCGKPMEQFKSEKPRVEPKRKHVNKVKQVYEYNLTPPRLNIGSGKETVQIKIPEKIRKECMLERSPNFKLSRNVPGNSYALRYQKGRT
ncbi:hypothetical protein Trydic_g20450 [Trypoxylus dichotomus]